MEDLGVTLGSVNVEAADPVALAHFWSQVLGSTPSTAGEQVYLPPARPGGFAMFFQPLGGPRPERQMLHVDLTVPWPTREAVVERLLSIGAAHRWDVLEEYEHVRWTTLADPEGNLFCVAEHPPAPVGAAQGR